MTTIVLASNNKHKIKEFKEIYKDNIILSLEEIGFYDDIEETGLTFLENALIDLYETELNKNKSIIKTVDKLRGFILLSEVHSLTHSWEVYCKNAHKKISFD